MMKLLNMAGVSAGDTAWMLVATALVLMMTPALGLYYAGSVRSRNTLNTFMMSLGAMGVVTITWVLIGYSFAFDRGGAFIGGLRFAVLQNVGFAPRPGTAIPHLLFFAFEGSFAIISAALISGAVVERMRFGAFMVFIALWSVLVYAVLAHWVWGGGWLAQHGVLDFAGGVPVETGAGFSALAAAIAVGPGRYYRRQGPIPHNAVYLLFGAGLLWFGWFGFNGGSDFAVNHPSVLAFVNTLLCPACTLVVWFVLDLVRDKKVTASGAATAVIVGCVGITPAAGYISPLSAMLLGAIAALPSYVVMRWRVHTSIDESLDVLAAHGMAGLTGIVFIGFFAQRSWNSVGNGLLFGHPSRLLWQVIAALAGPAYAFVGTYVLMRLVAVVMPLRASDADQATGMDLVEHGEEAYGTGEPVIAGTQKSGLDAAAVVV